MFRVSEEGTFRSITVVFPAAPASIICCMFAAAKDMLCK